MSLDLGSLIYGAVSPDGRSIVCRHKSEEGNTESRVAVFPFSPGNRRPTFFEIPIIDRVIVRWTVDGRSLTYAASESGAYNLWNRPITGGAPKRLTDISSNEIWDFAWSPDGKRLAYVLGADMQNVVLIRHSPAK